MYRTAYRAADVDGLSVFYREAGPQDAPTILLLHGFPSSSRMWQPLLDRLAGPFRLVAPDYPGFGHSDAPSQTQFAYTFDHLADVMDPKTRTAKVRCVVANEKELLKPDMFATVEIGRASCRERV